MKELARIEARCFPEAEAAPVEEMRRRLEGLPRSFFGFLEKKRKKFVTFINGMATNERIILDEMFCRAELHEEGGEWQTIFGVNTLPEYQGQGYASLVMRQVIADAKVQGRKGCILTCKEELLPFYERFGYRNEGVSQSVHGGAVWYDMRLIFEREECKKER